MSKPGIRIYRKATEIFPKRGFVSIISTPTGLMTDREAKKNNLGGEVICKIG
ncbi:MAG: 30S ribosomal protein S8 [Candidatus Paceibacteria bacterium]